MVEFININQEEPYLLFKKKYNEALSKDQKNIEAVCASSYNTNIKEVDSRYVNLKIIDRDKFIFFTNYNSPKSIAFNSFNQVAVAIYWSSINFQIRIKANINRTSSEYNENYYKSRSEDKNKLAIISDQSKKITSYDEVLRRYYNIEEDIDIKSCPDYWGGFYFVPYYFEFWEGHESRINKREVFEKIDGVWKQSFLQP